MNLRQYRTIIPIFKFTFPNSCEVLEYEDNINDFHFTISLRRYSQGEDFNFLVGTNDEQLKNKLCSIHSGFDSSTNYFLVINVFKPNNNFCLNTAEQLHISKAILTSLRLHSTKGIKVWSQYSFSTPKINNTVVLSSSESVRDLFDHLGYEISILAKESFNPCIQTFKTILDKNNLPPMIDLAVEYHATTSKVSRVDHAFLLLLTAFELLFKASEDETFQKATYRITKLLCETPKQRGEITKLFINGNNSFNQLRNKISHGDTSLDINAVKKAYPLLYKNISLSLISLLDEKFLDNLDGSQSYYDVLTTYIDDRFNALPEY